MAAAKPLTVEGTANKFQAVGADFMPLLQQQGVDYGDHKFMRW
jgi:hypothetical protein